jgi:hypothetical protein
MSRKYKGTLVVEHNEYVATFFLGKRCLKELGGVGNVGVAYGFIEMLEKLGYTVEIRDLTEESP